MKCFECSGELFESTTALHMEREGKLVIIEGVPAKVCKQCGEEYISGPVAEKVGKILDRELSKAKCISVPVIKWKVA